MSTIDDHRCEWVFWRKQVWESGCLAQQGIVDPPTKVNKSFFFNEWTKLSDKWQSFGS